MASSGERAVRAVPPPLRARLPRACCREDRIDGVLDMLLHFMAGGALECADALRIATRATALLSRERNLLHGGAPVIVVGDVQGQLYDLAKVLALASPLGATPLLFLGNYIGGGDFGLECVLVLLAAKIAAPHAVHLLRGNHECRLLSRVFALDRVCAQTYDAAVYEAIVAAFYAMPLAAVVARAYFCVHGGISMDIALLDDLDAVCRARETPTHGALCDLLWSDPYWDCDNQVSPTTSRVARAHRGTSAATTTAAAAAASVPSSAHGGDGGVDAYMPHAASYKTECTMMDNDARGCGSLFNYACVKYFLSVNRLRCIVRSHEVQDKGYKLYRPLPESTFPCMIGVYSAPNVADAFGNLGAVLRICEHDVTVTQFYAAPHPYVLHGLNAITWSLPFVAEKVTDAVINMVSTKRSRDNSGHNSSTSNISSDSTGASFVLHDSVMIS